MASWLEKQTDGGIPFSKTSFDQIHLRRFPFSFPFISPQLSSPSMRFPFSRRESLIPSITLHHRRYFFLLQNYFSFFNIESLLKVDFVSRISICTRLNPIQHFFIEKYEVEPRVLGELWILNKLRLFYRIPRYLGWRASRPYIIRSRIARNVDSRLRAGKWSRVENLLPRRCYRFTRWYFAVALTGDRCNWMVVQFVESLAEPKVSGLPRIPRNKSYENR